jgi:hypothetical protein
VQVDLARQRVAAALEADDVEVLVGPASILLGALADPAEHAGDRDVVANGHRLERLRDLVGASDTEVRSQVW